jgi:hypothetical protein
MGIKLFINDEDFKSVVKAFVIYRKDHKPFDIENPPKKLKLKYIFSYQDELEDNFARLKQYNADFKVEDYKVRNVMFNFKRFVLSNRKAIVKMEDV